jgi:NAD(P)-dependent dehydrogenase (short-subunit alcohol dehydrogenase family)
MVAATQRALRRSVLITGTSTGLGLATALYLAERDFDVYASMRDLARRTRLESEVTRLNVPIHVLQLDVTDPVSIDAAVHRVVDESGGIYGLVNNAGIGIGGYFEDLLDEEVRSVFDVNLFGAMATTRAVLPYMRAARQGRIVMMSSVAGRVSTPGVSPYCASKFALEGFGESLAQEVQPFGIYVSMIAPGIVKNEFWGIHRSIGQRALSPTSPYAHWFRAAEQLAEGIVDSAPTQTTDVVRAVHQALISPRPRLHQVVGWRPSLVALMRRYLPERWFERLYYGTVVRQIVSRAARPLPERA